MNTADQTKKNIIIAIFVGIVLWGAYLAVGAFYGPKNVAPNITRALIVIVCFALFLGFWSVLLLWFDYKKKRQQMQKEEEHRAQGAASDSDNIES